MKKHYYLNYIIWEDIRGKAFLVDLDQSWHPSLTSAQVHIDYLTK